jgi:hypothetical protein
MSQIIDNITVAVVSSLLSWFLGWRVRAGYENSKIEREKTKVYNWLHNATCGAEVKDKWRTTEVIANAVKLPKERVSYICSFHEGIRFKQENERETNEAPVEKWAIKKLVPEAVNFRKEADAFS